MRSWIIRATTFAWLATMLSVGTAQAITASYTLDNVFLNSSGDQMTGTFKWIYDEGDFEGGTGVFSELFIPGTTQTLNDLNIKKTSRPPALPL